MTDAGLASLAAHGCCASLAAVDLSWCRGVTGDGVRALAAVCGPALSRVVLWGCKHLEARAALGLGAVPEVEGHM